MAIGSLDSSLLSSLFSNNTSSQTQQLLSAAFNGGNTSQVDTARLLAGNISAGRSLTEFSGRADRTSNLSARLQTTADQLSSIPTSYVNPVSGAAEPTERTVDSYQADRLKSQLKGVVENFNATLTSAQSIGGDVASEVASINVSDNLKNLGVSVSKTGTLAFDETKFQSGVVAGATKLSDLKSSLTDLSAFASSVSSGVEKASTAARASAADVQAALQSESASLMLGSGGAAALISYGIGRTINYSG